MVNPIVAKHKNFVVRASLFFANELSCSEHGVQFGKRVSCWKCGTTNLNSRKKQVVSYYVDLAVAKNDDGSKMSHPDVIDILEKATGVKWNLRQGFRDFNVVAYSEQLLKFAEPMQQVEVAIEKLLEKANDKEAIKVLRAL